MYQNGSPSVLLVEDNPDDAFFVKELLDGFVTSQNPLHHAPDLRSAVAIIGVRAIGAVLLDLHLPDAAGSEAVRAIRAVACDLPIVVLTGLEDDGLALECIALGAQDYLDKSSLRPDSLRRSIAYAVARTRELVHQRQASELERKLAAIVECSSDGIVGSAPDGVITSWNRGAERIFGFTAEEAIGKRLREVSPVLDEEGAQPAAGQALVPTTSGEPIVLRRMTKEGSQITVSMVRSAVLDREGRTEGFATIIRDVTELRRKDEELRVKNAELVDRDGQMRALAERLNDVREDERTRISRTVHDNLGQLMTGLKMDLRWVSRRLDGNGEIALGAVRERLQEAERLADETIATIQKIAIELRPSVLDTLGLAAAIRDEARRFQARSGVVTHVAVEEHDPPSPDLSTALFRIIQELLTNVARHAHASRVDIRLSADHDGWTLVVRDNGVGFPAGAAARCSSLGLLGMRERAATFGGTLTLEASVDGGTIATAQIPRKRDEVDAASAHR